MTEAEPRWSDAPAKEAGDLHRLATSVGLTVDQSVAILAGAPPDAERRSR